jgi:RHS repeat-associated protein
MDVTYGYDLDGKVTRTTVELNSYSYTYSYDARGRFEKITDALTGQLQYQYYYDAASNLTKRHNFINNVDQVFTYNALDWITDRDLLKGTTPLASETYNHNPLGQVTLIDRDGTNDDRFGYYLNGELNWATYDSTVFKDMTYTLDRGGNRIKTYDGSTWKNYTATGINQYTTAEDLAVTTNAEHQITLYNGITFGYLNDGQLTYVSNGTSSMNFYYDALGRCVKRVKDGWDAKYSYYDGERELLECGSGGGAAYRNVYGKGIDEILMRQDTTNNWLLYFQQDHLGNVTELTWGSGDVVEIFQYDAFGLLNKTASGWGVPFLFNGRRYLSEYGIYEYRARGYHPKLGRFTSEDPKLFDAGDYNLFRYCDNDPLDRTDPMGLDFKDDYEGRADKFYLSPNPVVRSGEDFYGITPGQATVRVTPAGNNLVLQKYDVWIGQRQIATKTRAWGARRERAIEATKEHEEKHVAKAKEIHDRYAKLINQVIGHVGAGEDAGKAASIKDRELREEFGREWRSHEPKSEWSDIRKREDDGNTRHNFNYYHYQQQQIAQQRFESPSTQFFIQIVHY